MIESNVNFKMRDVNMQDDYDENTHQSSFISSGSIDWMPTFSQHCWMVGSGLDYTQSFRKPALTDCLLLEIFRRLLS